MDLFSGGITFGGPYYLREYGGLECFYCRHLKGVEGI